MASRFARPQLLAGTRLCVRAKAPARSVARRWISTSHGQKKESDMPWIIGSAIVFGPAFLYLLSPSSRKTAPAPNASHSSDSHTSKKKVVVKDDEGTPADVTTEVHTAIAEDAPKADGAEASVSATEKTEDSEQSPETKADEPTLSEESQSPPAPSEQTEPEAKHSSDDSAVEASVSEPSNQGEVSKDASKEGSAPEKAET